MDSLSGGHGFRYQTSQYFSVILNEELNQKVNKNNKYNSKSSSDSFAKGGRHKNSGRQSLPVGRASVRYRALVRGRGHVVGLVLAGIGQLPAAVVSQG